jgi:tyrosinase
MVAIEGRWSSWWLPTLALAGVIFSLSPALAADQIVQRKNIDKLTPQELAAYEHAIQIMKDRSATNQYDKTGYLWQAWVHNCPATWVPKDGKEDGRKPLCNFWQGGAPATADRPRYNLLHPGMCEHGKDLFLPWHRAEFYYFETVLQGTDPQGTITDSRGQTGPSTKNLAVPYWNWTRPPTGARYPLAFENPKSPLFHDNRASDPISSGSAYPFASAYLVAYMIRFQDWPTFGGHERATRGGYGSFEAVTHNPMHSLYMAGDMANPATAALDPVFFSFHAYIDLLYEMWLQDHGKDSVTSQNFFLRGDQPDNVKNPPGFVAGAGERSMGQVKLFFDTKALGYEYEIASDDQLMTREQLTKTLGLDDQQDPPIFGQAARNLISRLLEDGGYQPSRRPSFVRTLDIKIPSGAIANDQSFAAILDRNPQEADLSYQMDVYVYPKQAPFDSASQPFRSRYLAGTGVHWGTGALHDHDDVNPMNLDISRAILDLIKGGSGGETWNISMAITVLPSLTSFGEPSVQANPPIP